MTRYSIVRSDVEWVVQLHTPDHAQVFAQTVSPSTGHGSGTAQHLQEFTGGCAMGRALAAWMKATGLVRG